MGRVLAAGAPAAGGDALVDAAALTEAVGAVGGIARREADDGREGCNEDHELTSHAPMMRLHDYGGKR